MCGFVCVRSKGPTPRQVERQIRSDVPPGTPRAAVEDYLRGRGIEFTAEERGPGEELSRVVSNSGLREGEIKAFIRATVEPAFVNMDLLFRGDVLVFFLFDGEGLLLGYAFIPRDFTP